jgi:hypothetical protein
LARIIISVVYSQQKVNFNCSADGKGLFSFGAPSPSPGVLVGRLIQLKFPDVQFQASQNAIQELGEISLRLQEELVPHLKGLVWERLGEQGYGRPVKVLIAESFGPWILNYISPADAEFSVVFDHE